MLTSEAGTGIDRYTGKVIAGWDHVQQSLEVIWSTRIGERVLREEFGNPGLRLLGEAMLPRVILVYWNTVVTVTAAWEPRFTILRVTSEGNTPETMRAGAIQFQVHGVYRPRAHLGDPTPEGRRVVSAALSAVNGLRLVR